ncbi:MAG: hypothetical protein KBE91_08210 [Bacteroidia bacterium]|nr:hypothetical protein [Bacteroidia bacterium]MBP9689579.1 hypothetical protein [Bacteroidia bacterium]
MTRIYILCVYMLAAVIQTWACDACDKQQPQITRGITHGTGPNSNWDWLIVGIIFIITVLTLVLSIKYIIKPSEKNDNHIKRLILNN